MKEESIIYLTEEYDVDSSQDSDHGQQFFDQKLPTEQTATTGVDQTTEK